MTFDVCLTSLLITEYSYRRPNICYCFFEFLILFPVRGSMLSIRLILLNSCAFQCLFLLYGLGYSILSKSFGFLYSSLDITSPVSTLTMIPGLISLKSTICVKMNRFLLLSSKQQLLLIPAVQIYHKWKGRLLKLSKRPEITNYCIKGATLFESLF